jgi:hypothetical protein
MIYEALSRHSGWTGRRVGKAATVDDIGNSADILWGWRWWLSKTDGLTDDPHVLEYKATYDDPWRIWREMAVAVNLTSPTFAVGLEYTMLEAMDAGCSVVMPSHCFNWTGREQYAAYTLDRWKGAPSITKKVGYRLDRFDRDSGEELVQQVTLACDAFAVDSAQARTNQRALGAYHAPQHLARQILESL